MTKTFILNLAVRVNRCPVKGPLLGTKDLRKYIFTIVSWVPPKRKKKSENS